MTQRAPAARQVRWWSMSRLTGRRVLVILCFFFGCVFAVNGVFLYLALDSHPGTTAVDAYREGLGYNRTLERAELQKERGWDARIGNEGGHVLLRVTDMAGSPVTDLRGLARTGRPASAREDRTVELVEIAPGIYRPAGASLKAGRWQVVFEVTDPAGHPFRWEGQVMVAP